MTKRLLTILFFSAFAIQLVAQTVPQGINYQAVLRNSDGSAINNTTLSVKVEFLTDYGSDQQKVVYSESHLLTTNNFGLAQMVLGQGKTYQGKFETIPWETGNVWIRILSDVNRSSQYEEISAVKLFSVPYALYAQSAGKVKNGQVQDNSRYSFYEWKTGGNYGTNPNIHFLGNWDAKDLVIKTSSIERMRIMAGGDISMINTLMVGEHMYVTDSSVIGGSSHVMGNFFVDGTSQFGGTVAINGPLNLTERLTVRYDDANHVAEFENTNNNNGDGIKIKLGKTHPRWSNGSEVKVPNIALDFFGTVPEAAETIIFGLLDNGGSFSGDDFSDIANELSTVFGDKFGNALTSFNSTACELTNDLIGEINSGLDLPWDFPAVPPSDITLFPSIEIFPGIDLDPLGEIPAIETPDITVAEGFITSGFRVFDEIPEINCPNPPTMNLFTVPNVAFSDVSNSLTNENEYLLFTDESDRWLGSVRAESIDDWRDRFLSPIFYLNVVNSFAGVTDLSVDPTVLVTTVVKYAINGATQFSNVLESYNSIGVEYASGFGDYAEWLERSDPYETIRPGDIVAVKGGKITTDLAGAEQVMAVSTKPIVLGNTPPEGKGHLGNKIAFMGQIPVKIMGPVESGDYIVGNPETPAYGYAVSPDKITPDELALAVGRSWENREGEGPKMVNTVIGVHNGDYLHIIRGMQEKIRNTEDRLDTVEQQTALLMKMMNAEAQAKR